MRPRNANSSASKAPMLAASSVISSRCGRRPCVQAQRNGSSLSGHGLTASFGYAGTRRSKKENKVRRKGRGRQGELAYRRRQRDPAFGELRHEQGAARSTNCHLPPPQCRHFWRAIDRNTGRNSGTRHRRRSAKATFISGLLYFYSLISSRNCVLMNERVVVRLVSVSSALSTIVVADVSGASAFDSDSRSFNSGLKVHSA